jgi:glycerol-1-phosphate dehydrogenase [NAD(P)+]
MGAIMEGLVLAGVGMSYVGNSRPASGSEHHLAHYWEMMFLQAGQEEPLHGTKV